jgi:hypothetical protein
MEVLMGILDGLVDNLRCSRWIMYNFEKIYSDYKKRKPDVSLWREHDNRPCPYYIYIIMNDGKIRIEFFQSFLKSDIRFSELKEKQHKLNIKLVAKDVLTQYSSPYIEDIKI